MQNFIEISQKLLSYGQNTYGDALQTWPNINIFQLNQNYLLNTIELNYILYKL